jgi:hypothetical protein
MSLSSCYDVRSMVHIAQYQQDMITGHKYKMVLLQLFPTITLQAGRQALIQGTRTRHAGKQAGRQAGRHATSWQAGRQARRQAGRQCRQAGRQAGKHMPGQDLVAVAWRVCSAQVSCMCMLCH